MMSLVICIFHKILSHDLIKKIEIGSISSPNGRNDTISRQYCFLVSYEIEKIILQ